MGERKEHEMSTWSAPSTLRHAQMGIQVIFDEGGFWWTRDFEAWYGPFDTIAECEVEAHDPLHDANILMQR